jgi:hypothetical protein
MKTLRRLLRRRDRSWHRACRRAGVSLVLAVLLALACAGCTRTVTLTAKYRSAVGWYFVCDGSGSLLGDHLNPCRKGHVWRVTRGEYDQAVVGRTYTVTIG